MSNTPSQAPGWYYAQGDPPGTQRYWDGAAWQGGPQPLAGAGGASPTGNNAAPGDRFVAALIDVGIMMVGVIVGIILMAIAGAIAEALGGIMLLVVLLGVFVYSIYNYIYLQGTTGQTIGKKMRNVKLVSKTTGQPLGMLMVWVRGLVVNLLSSFCGLDHFWILFDENNQRLSDNMLGNHVVEA